MKFFPKRTARRGVPDRASRRFFTSAILRPNGGSAFASVSQKILSATACRYMILWCSLLLQKIECNDQHFMCLFVCLIPKFVLQIHSVKACLAHQNKTIKLLANHFLSLLGIYFHLFKQLLCQVDVWFNGCIGNDGSADAETWEGAPPIYRMRVQTRLQCLQICVELFGGSCDLPSRSTIPHSSQAAFSWTFGLPLSSKKSSVLYELR